MIRQIFFLFSLLALPLLSHAAGENLNYFSVREDLRKCPSPQCGGVFVQNVNRRTTRCADGRFRSECYVAEVDLSALHLSPEAEAPVRARIQQGTVLLKGKLAARPFGPLGGPGEFFAAEVWLAATDAQPAGTFYRTVDTGLVCVAAPCLSFREFKLNTLTQRDIAGVDLSSVGASEHSLAKAREALPTPGGILVAGKHITVSGPAGEAPSLVASQFYLPVPRGQ